MYDFRGCNWLKFAYWTLGAIVTEERYKHNMVTIGHIFVVFFTRNDISK